MEEPGTERERDPSNWPSEKDEDEPCTPGHSSEDEMSSIGLKHCAMITSG